MTTTGSSKRMTSAVAAATLGGTLLLAACGSGGSKGAGGNSVTSKQPPEAAVATALSDLGHQSSVGMALSLPITAAQAQQLARQGGSKLTSKEAQALTTGSIFISETTGNGEAVDSHQAVTDPGDGFDFGLRVGSDTPVEVMYVGQNLYVRARVSQLMSDVGRDPAKVAKFTAEVRSLDTYVPGLKALADGSWVEITHASLQSLAPALKQIEGQAGVSPGGLQAQMLQLRTQLLAAVKANSTFAALPDGSGYSLTVNVANLIQAVKPEITSALGSVPGVGSQLSTELAKAARSVPARRTAVVDLHVTANKLSRADVDLNQFAKHKMSFAVPLQVTFSSPGMPTPPSGATALDLSKLPALLGSLLGGK